VLPPLTAPALALCRSRLAARFGARAGWVLAAVGAAVFAVAAADGATVGADAAQAFCWLAAGPAALAAAAAPAERDRVEGVEALAFARGLPPLGRARVAAAALACALRVGLPTLLVVLAAAAADPSGRAFASASLLTAGAFIAGALVGALGAGSGEVGGERGRSLLVALVVLPWLAADLAGASWMSLPGIVHRGLGWLEAISA
jgi:hypothetical protein